VLWMAVLILLPPRSDCKNKDGCAEHQNTLRPHVLKMCVHVLTLGAVHSFVCWNVVLTMTEVYMRR
jgi:hypothetical protein